MCAFDENAREMCRGYIERRRQSFKLIEFPLMKTELQDREYIFIHCVMHGERDKS
jgi:hypothetical protein